MAIIDKQGKIRDVKNVHFPEILTHGSPEEKQNIGESRLYQSLLCNHNVKYFDFEKIKLDERKIK